jgi:hypothetical protein
LGVVGEYILDVMFFLFRTMFQIADIKNVILT